MQNSIALYKLCISNGNRTKLHTDTCTYRNIIISLYTNETRIQCRHGEKTLPHQMTSQHVYYPFSIYKTV